MKMIAKVHYNSQLNAVLIRGNGERVIVGDVDKNKPWYQRMFERLGYDQRGLVTDQGVADLTTDFTASGGLAVFKFHDSGTGTTPAAVTDTALQTQAGPTTRATASSQTSTGSSSTSPATMTSVGTINYTSTLAITEWGLFNQAAQGGHLWDHRVFSAINVVSGDSIQFTYTLSVASGGS